MSFTKGAVIVENRFNVAYIIERHKKFLPADWGVIHLNLPHIKTERDYNKLLTSEKFWKELPFDKVLIFQHDSGLLKEGIEDFLKWDYVGAPWKFQHHGGNGGLSIRSKQAMLNVLKNRKYTHDRNEDVFFSNAMKEMGLNLAPREVCEKFACEAIFKMGTIGYHAIEKWLTKQECEQIKTQYNHG